LWFIQRHFTAGIPWSAEVKGFPQNRVCDPRMAQQLEKCMATAIIRTIYCVQQATGTDGGLNQAILALPELIVPHFGGASLVNEIRALPGVIEAIDAVRADPDDLYVTTNTEGGRDNAIWPGPGRNGSMRAGQSVAPNISVDFADSQNISLWDYDSVSRDDLLGSITIFESERGPGEMARVARSAVEGSCYYIIYSVA
jgi:hypothetical protein